MVHPVRQGSQARSPLSEQVISAEKDLWQWSFGMKLRSGCFLQNAAGFFKVMLVDSLAQIRIQPWDIDADRALHHAARTSCTQLAESRLEQSPVPVCPRSAISPGLGFAP